MTKKDEQKIELIQTLEAFAEVVSKEITVKKGERDVVYRVFALTPVQYDELWEQHEAQKPKLPSSVEASMRKPEGKRPPDYAQRLEKHKKNVEAWQNEEIYWYLYYGWAKPNAIVVPGQTDYDKVKHLYDIAGSVGDALAIIQAIKDVSGLRKSDVDFM